MKKSYHHQPQSIIMLIRSNSLYWGAEGAPILFSELGFVWLHVRIYIYLSQMAARFLDFTKLLLALSSLTQPFDQMRSIPEHFCIILSHRQACAGRFREETTGKRRGLVTKWPHRRLLFTRLEIVFVIISSFTKRTKVVHE